MSPKSRSRRKVAKQRPAARGARGGGQRRDPAQELHGDRLQDARRLLSTGDPLEAELWGSRLLGELQATPMPTTDLHWLAVHALIRYVRARPVPQARALLQALRAVGSPTLRAAVIEADVDLADRGVPEPDWTARVGGVKAGRAWRRWDVYGDVETVFCTFHYGEHAHLLAVRMDHTRGSVPTNIELFTDAEQFVGMALQVTASDPSMTMEEISPAEAQVLLEGSINQPDRIGQMPLGEEVYPLLALMKVRLQALPVGTAQDRPRYDRADQQAAVADFLASAYAQRLPDPFMARFWAEVMAGHSGRFPHLNPRGGGPTRLVEVLLMHVPFTFPLRSAHRQAMPEVLGAWVDWMVEQQGLTGAPASKPREVLAEILEKFPARYDDPTLVPCRAYLADVAERLVEGAGPAVDLNEVALRRMAAVPYPPERVGKDVTLGLDAADPAGRNAVLANEFGDCDPPPGRSFDEFLAAVDLVCTHLWDDDPPEVWRAAQAVIEAAGLTPHDVLHILAEVVLDHGGAAELDPATYRRALVELPGSPAVRDKVAQARVLTMGRGQGLWQY